MGAKSSKNKYTFEHWDFEDTFEHIDERIVPNDKKNKNVVNISNGHAQNPNEQKPGSKRKDVHEKNSRKDDRNKSKKKRRSSKKVTRKLSNRKKKVSLVDPPYDDEGLGMYQHNYQDKNKHPHNENKHPYNENKHPHNENKHPYNENKHPHDENKHPHNVKTSLPNRTDRFENNEHILKSNANENNVPTYQTASREVDELTLQSNHNKENSPMSQFNLVDNNVRLLQTIRVENNVTNNQSINTNNKSLVEKSSPTKNKVRILQSSRVNNVHPTKDDKIDVKNNVKIDVENDVEIDKSGGNSDSVDSNVAFSQSSKVSNAPKHRVSIERTNSPPIIEINLDYNNSVENRRQRAMTVPNPNMNVVTIEKSPTKKELTLDNLKVHSNEQGQFVLRKDGKVRSLRTPSPTVESVAFKPYTNPKSVVVSVRRNVPAYVKRSASTDSVFLEKKSKPKNRRRVCFSDQIYSTDA